MYKKILDYISLVKFSHTIFALPFALLGFFWSITLGGGEWSVKLLILILLCMLFARNAAMAFNRYSDRKYDKLNPRTASREIPSGIISEKGSILFIVSNVILFIATTYLINNICFYLSPVAISVILFYSLTKRFTSLCHIVLGVALSIAPIGASLAVLGEFRIFPMLIGVVVFFWVSGFDILYALQDEKFDKNNKLNSIPSLLGIKGALITSSILHFLSIITILLLGLLFNMNYLYFISASIFSIILAWEHIVVTPSDIKRVNVAFATMNAYASIIFSALAIISFYL